MDETQDVNNVNETESQTQDNGTQLDNNQVTPQVQPQAPEIDYRALYAQSVRERQQREQELEMLRQQQLAQSQARENLDVTDADIEKLGTVETISRIVRKQLQDSLADVGEVSRDFKRQKQLDQAEMSFYQQFPHLAQYREVLSSTIRGQLQNSPYVDPNTFATQAFATIGYYTAMNAANPQVNTQVAQPPRQNPPTRTNGAPTPTSRTAPKLSELERTAIRKAGYDPNKREDVDAFFAIVNNDEGISV